jgi:hypothetical protein
MQGGCTARCRRAAPNDAAFLHKTKKTILFINNVNEQSNEKNNLINGMFVVDSRQQ